MCLARPLYILNRMYETEDILNIVPGFSAFSGTFTLDQHFIVSHFVSISVLWMGLDEDQALLLFNTFDVQRLACSIHS